MKTITKSSSGTGDNMRIVGGNGNVFYGDGFAREEELLRLSKNITDVSDRLMFLETEVHELKAEELKRVDDSEGVSLSKNDKENIILALEFYENNNVLCNRWVTSQLISKLNKMLKEKE